MLVLLTRSRLAAVAVVVALAAAFLSPVVTNASARINVERFAKVLRKRDPGKNVNGTTIIGTKPGALLRGAPDRINFMVALVNGERLAGGNGHDEMSAYYGTRGVRIDAGAGRDLINGLGRDQRLSGGDDNDLIYGGPGKDRLDGGPGNDTLLGGRGDDTISGGSGNDTIVDHRGATTVVTGAGQDVVDVADGHGKDRVVCERGGGDQVMADAGDQLSRACHRLPATARAAEIARHPNLAIAEPHAGAAQNTTVIGDGSNFTPFTTPTGGCAAPGGDPNSHVVNCFVPRTLQGFGHGESVPAYQCPGDFPYLQNQNFAPFGTSLINGVEVSGLGPIGVSITGALSDPITQDALGSSTGGGNSSATLWRNGPLSYQVVLHCEKYADDGWVSA